MPRPSNKPIQLLKGFKDILPEHQDYWEFFTNKAKVLMDAYGFKKIDVPILEQTNLYIKGTGKHTDIIEKELYSFEDKSGDNISLRPEFTPGIARAYIEHGMLNKIQPIKLYSLGPVFRHDNPQLGRFRQFHQLNLEAIGSDSPVVDAELIIIAYKLLQSLGLAVTVHLNSIGCLECRAEYITRLKQFLQNSGRKKELCDSCKERYFKNPLRILDCKEISCQEVLADAPQIVDYLDEECKKHFMTVLDYLDDLEIKYNLNVKLVRGLDYYTRTTFEIYLADEDTSKSQGSLAGGGRYDGLIEIIGGRPTPAIGFAVGIERVISKLREQQITVPAIDQIDVFVAQLGVEARKECFKLYQKLTDAGVKVAEAFSKDSLKSQMEKADQLGAKIVLILGQKELMDKTIIIRDMQSGIQEIVNYDKTVEQVKKKIDPVLSEVKSYRIEVKDNLAENSEQFSEKKQGALKQPKKNKDFKSSLDLADDDLLKDDIVDIEDKKEDYLIEPVEGEDQPEESNKEPIDDF